MINIFDTKPSRIINLRPFFYMMLWDGGWWFRFFRKYGVHCKHIDKNMILFSERNGFVKFLQVGKWRFRFLN